MISGIIKPLSSLVKEQELEAPQKIVTQEAEQVIFE